MLEKMGCWLQTLPGYSSGYWNCQGKAGRTVGSYGTIGASSRAKGCKGDVSAGTHLLCPQASCLKVVSPWCLQMGYPYPEHQRDVTWFS